MKTKEEILQAIVQQGALPLFYNADIEISMQATRTLYKAGIRAMEFTNRAEGALEVYKEVRKAVTTEMPDMLFGAGTIKTVKDAIAFEQAGASLTFFAEEQTNRNMFGWQIPASWFQSFNPVGIIILAPLFTVLWGWLGARSLPSGDR